MADLKPPSIGQIWQCRDQRYSVKVLLVNQAIGRFTVQFIDRGNVVDGNKCDFLLTPWSDTTKSWYAYTGDMQGTCAPHAILSLLYDPLDAQIS